MDELIGRLAGKVDINNVLAKNPIGITPGFLCNKGPSNKVQIFISKIPGAKSAIPILSNNSSPGGLMRVA